MKLYRCSCHFFSPLNNKLRYIVKNLILDQSKKVLHMSFLCSIEYIFFEIGGCLDEYLIIKEIKKMRKKNRYRGCIKISIFEDLYDRKRQRKLIDCLIKKITKDPLLSIGLITSNEVELRNYIFSSQRDVLFLVALDEYYFSYDAVFKSEECLNEMMKNTIMTFSFRLYLIKILKKTYKTLECSVFNSLIEKNVFFNTITKITSQASQKLNLSLINE